MYVFGAVALTSVLGVQAKEFTEPGAPLVQPRPVAFVNP